MALAAQERDVPLTYQAFLARKSQLDGEHGFAPMFLPDFLFDFQKALVEWAVRKGRAAIFADCGLGKALASETPIITPTGNRPIGSLQNGDEVIGSKGHPVEVLGVFPQGTRQMYRIGFSDGVTIRADADHLWYVETQLQRYHNRPGRVLSTAALASKPLYDDVRRSRYFLPLVSAPVVFKPVRLPLDAYLLGVLLGDGWLMTGHQSSVEITSADDDLVASLIFPPGLRAVRRKDDGTRTPSYRLSCERTGTNRRNPLIVALEELGLRGLYSCEKFVPPIYLTAATADRLALLQGLMDTDGYGNADGLAQFTSTSTKLATDVQNIVQGLGGTATIRPKWPVCVTADGGRVDGAPAWNVTVRLPHGMTPFRLDRKRRVWRPHSSYTPCRAIRSIEPDGLDDATCIAVRSADQLFAAHHLILTHNTPMQLVWAENIVRHTNKRVLIVTPLAVGAQTVREGEKFDIECGRSNDGHLRGSITITNYERLHYFQPDDFIGVVCDESSILKHFSGATQKAVTRFLSKIPYRLLCTATAAPNDYTELGTSSEALGYLGYSDMLSRFFIMDDKKRHRMNDVKLARGAKTGNYYQKLSYRVAQQIGAWRLKGHAEEPFWRWVCSWARACRQPSDLGFADHAFRLPPLTEREHIITPTRPPDGMLFTLPAFGLAEEREERRRTLVERCETAATLIAHSDPAVVWCHFNAEGDRLAAVITDSRQVKGAQSLEEREEIYTAFASEALRVIVLKPKLGAWGLNWQHCNHVVTFASHSYEQYYQSIRRCWRFGQTRPVSVDIIATTGERHVRENMVRKSEAAAQMFTALVRHMSAALGIRRIERHGQPTEVPAWVSSSNQ